MVLFKKLINIIFKKKQTIITYKDEFNEAINRTKRFKLKLPHVDMNDDILLNEEFEDKFNKVMMKEILQHKDVFLQCYILNYKIKKILDEQLDYNFMYTIGYIELDGEPRFKSTEKDLFKMIQNSRPDYNNDGVKIHVWLTLPSMEIVDLTLPTTLQYKFPEIPDGSVLKMHTDNNHYLRYKPQLVGDDFFKKLKVF
ncbi:MAG: hypothetical protein WC665_05615 [Sulfurimonas sp.]|jgi:hypothetical protein